VSFARRHDAVRDPEGGLLVRDATGPRTRGRAFSVVELLVVVAVIALLLAMLLPGLSAARREARRVKCASNLRQLGHAFHMYAFDYGGTAMPLAYFNDWPLTYWYGRDTGLDNVDETHGFVWPYLGSELRDWGVYECPEQPAGTFDRFQGACGTTTSTYGYNGYFLSPAATPGWAGEIGQRPWQNIDELAEPQAVFVFADTMIDWFGELKNCALLDPPFVYRMASRTWYRNESPTTAFRHGWRANAVHADGHATAVEPNPKLIMSPDYHIGSAGRDNAPHYVPDWREW
jgi:type II secretory pathway pseudopilin PulG